MKINRNNPVSGTRGRKSEDQRAAALARDAAVKEEIEKDRAKSAAKSARLRALRLAKEAADKAEADKRETDNPSERKIAKAPAKRRVRIFG